MSQSSASAKAPHSRTLTAIEELAQPLAAAHGCVVEQVRVHGPHRQPVVLVVVDDASEEPGAPGASLDTVGLISRDLSAALDETDLFPQQAYTLELSTPGIDRPLKTLRQWRRNIGRSVALSWQDNDGSRHRRTVRIQDVSEQDVTVAVALDEGKSGNQTLMIPHSHIEKAVVQVEFNAPTRE